MVHGVDVIVGMRLHNRSRKFGFSNSLSVRLALGINRNFIAYIFFTSN